MLAVTKGGTIKIRIPNSCLQPTFDADCKTIEAYDFCFIHPSCSFKKESIYGKKCGDDTVFTFKEGCDETDDFSLKIGRYIIQVMVRQQAVCPPIFIYVQKQAFSNLNTC